MDFERIYRLYFKDVFLYLRALSASTDTAEEITQETFVKALRSISSFDGSKDIRVWLFTIARNTYYTYCRRQARYADEELQENEPDIQPDFTERFVRGDESRTDGGSGLGLAIAKSFTEACGGRFLVRTEADLFAVEITFRTV